MTGAFFPPIFSRMRALILFLVFAATPLSAQNGAQMNGPDFRALSEGYTLHFESLTGEYFGSEQYFEDGRTIWRPAFGECERGVWAEDHQRGQPSFPWPGGGVS
ncbi:MAG: hypothetical protein AAF401_18390 [Pseudomonadota bacterium]